MAVDRSYITRIVNGKKTPAPDMAKRIGLLLGFDWRIFYTDGVGALEHAQPSGIKSVTLLSQAVEEIVQRNEPS